MWLSNGLVGWWWADLPAGRRDTYVGSLSNMVLVFTVKWASPD